jgi:hypothetical protein
MSMPIQTTPLGPFLQQVKERLSALSLEELKAILVERARTLEARERTSFLSWLSPKTSAPPAALLTEIDMLVTRLTSGHYFQEWSQGEPSRALGDESWASEMDALFSGAAQVYLRGEYHLAAQAYGTLLHAFRLEAEGDVFCGARSAQEMVKTELDEAKTRYLRALYEATAEARAARMLEEFITLANIGSWKILLRDVEAAEELPLPEGQAFYQQFEEQLRAQPREGQNRLYPREDLRRALLREVVALQRGATGLRDLAKEEGDRHPEIYHELLEILVAAHDHEALFAVARDGMLHIEDLTERALFADRVSQLSLNAGDETLALAAKVQAFRATPTQSRLLQLLAFIPEEDVDAWSTRELEEARHRVLLPESVTTWLSLLRGDTKTALRYLQNASSLGWSRPEHPGKVAFPTLLLIGCGQAPPARSSLYELLQSINATEEGPTATNAGSRQITAAILRHSLSLGERTSILEAVVRLAEKRIRAIISHQHKKAFGRAAQLSVACAEAYHLANLPEEGDAFLAALLEEFRRHTTFREEAEKKRAASVINTRVVALAPSSS